MKGHYRFGRQMTTFGRTVLRSLWVSLCWLVVVAPASAETLSGRAHAKDGDSLTLRGQQVRLFGIDALEYRQRCGRVVCGRFAADALKNLIQGQTVTCARQDTDSYGRMVAICRLPDGRDLAREMVRRGYAVAYRRYSSRYVADEQAARKAKSGAWAHGFQNPFDYRRSQ